MDDTVIARFDPDRKLTFHKVDGILVGNITEDLMAIGTIRDKYLGISLNEDSSTAWKIASLLTKVSSDISDVYGAKYH